MKSKRSLTDATSAGFVGSDEHETPFCSLPRPAEACRCPELSSNHEHPIPEATEADKQMQSLSFVLQFRKLRYYINLSKIHIPHNYENQIL